MYNGSKFENEQFASYVYIDTYLHKIKWKHLIFFSNFR